MARLYFFIALVVLAPLPVGGNIPMAWTGFAILAGVMALWISIETLIQKQAIAVPCQWVWFPTTVFLGVCVWALIQSLSIMPGEWHHPLWSVAAKALEQEISGAISINPYGTRTALLRLMTYGAVFWIALQLGRERRQANYILHGIVFAIAVHALFVLIFLSTGSENTLWFEKSIYGKRLTSTFVNPNNFATFIGMGSVAFLVLLIGSLRGSFSKWRDEQAKHVLGRLIHLLSGAAGLYILALMVTMTALFLSGSRGGFIATIFSMGIIIAFNLLKNRVGLFSIGVALAAATGVLVSLLDLGGRLFAHRLQGVESAVEQRSAVYKQTLQAIADSPWLGTGYGTFRDVFPIYRNEPIAPWGVWDMAHNTYLENLLELGIPAALMLFVAILACVWLCFRGALIRRRAGYFPLIGFAVSVLVAVHALVDFSLQIPGVAITYAALLGLGVAQSWRSQK